MSLSTHIPQLNFAQAKHWLKACIKAKVTPVLYGPPGVGKTALCAEVAHEVNLPLRTLIGSTCEPTDIGGFPVVVDGSLQRIPLLQVRQCADEAGILFIDELTTVPLSVQAPLMRGLLEHQFGDVKLHPDSTVIGACNQPEHAPSAFEFTAATGSRLLQAILTPSHDEVADFFRCKLGEPGTPLGDEGLDFAVTMGQLGDLLEMEPPQNSIQKGVPWGCPRAWERGLRAYVAADESSKIGEQCLASAVGQAKAIQYIAIKKHRQFLPSINEIIANPAAAKLPADKERQVAIIGLIARVAQKDVYAAWVYIERLQGEFGMTCTRMMMRYNNNAFDPKAASAWKKQGMDSRLRAIHFADSFRKGTGLAELQK